jgi:proteasome accessory factor A
MTAVQVQWEYLEHARKYVERTLGGDADAETIEVLDRWASLLDRLEDDPMRCREELDWVAKLSLLESYRERDHLDWDHPKLQLIDLQYSDVRLDKGLYHRLVRLGKMQRLLPDADVAAAVSDPPDNTRAYFRGRCLAKYPNQVAAASWDSVIFDLPGRESLQRIPTLEPLRGTRDHVGGLLDRCDTAEQLFAALTSPGRG